MIWNNKNLINILKEDGVVVMPTDTLYGIVGKALNASVVDRIYAIRKRNPEKPCIILIGDIEELKKFNIVFNKAEQIQIKKYTEPTSFIVDCKYEKFSYLHRGTETLAFRIPTPKGLRDLLLKTGPLIAPSANLEALPPSETIAEAKKYFGDGVDLYIDGGTIRGKASKIIELHKDGSVTTIRA